MQDFAIMLDKKCLYGERMEAADSIVNMANTGKNMLSAVEAAKWKVLKKPANYVFVAV